MGKNKEKFNSDDFRQENTANIRPYFKAVD